MRLTNMLATLAGFWTLVLAVYTGSLLSMSLAVPMTVVALKNWVRQEAHNAVQDVRMDILREQFRADAPDDMRDEFERLYEKRLERRQSWWRGYG